MKKETARKVELHTTFKLANLANVQNVVLALSMSGYIVNVGTDGIGYRVDIYRWA